jgi:hypothetical protein
MRQKEEVTMKRVRLGRLCGRSIQGRPAILLLSAFVCSVALAAAATAAEPTFVFVDLQAQANQKLSDDLHNSEGNNLAKVPQGEQKLGETRFKIGEKMIHVRGTAGAADAPLKVEGVPVNAKFDRLHILHSTGYGEAMNEPFADGTEIGSYVVRYADKSTEHIGIIYGEDLRDWYDWPDRPDVKRAKVAWTGTNAASENNQRQIRLFEVVWENPHPDKEVATIDVESKETVCDPFLVALTLEKK